MLDIVLLYTHISDADMYMWGLNKSIFLVLTSLADRDKKKLYNKNRSC